ncbi:MgtC/SapB family protein [Novosphingobium sp. FSW06-99]|uniref:MgtC/SapB family protein n=1 Tax=Novosphingobium sp. FSW06-99 TaxID=1739113 RepID=UPI001E49514B|nr:MgtC/SapB family protein [Novosphingobium sp. FSW06-99]
MTSPFAAFVIEPNALFTSLICLATAFVLGVAIGLERQWRQRSAGLRTNVLVAVGAAAFVDLGLRSAGAEGSVRVISYVVSGIGFLGAGVIMKDGTQVRGLNTAATLWASAAVGAFAGARLPAEAALVTLFVLAGNTLLRPLVEFVDRRPMRPGETEALYRVHVTVPAEQVAFARDLLFDELERHHYPIREIETLAQGKDSVELAAVLVPSRANEADLDAIVDHLARHDEVISATWTVSTTS